MDPVPNRPNGAVGSLRAVTAEETGTRSTRMTRVRQFRPVPPRSSHVLFLFNAYFSGMSEEGGEHLDSVTELLMDNEADGSRKA